MVKYKTKDKAPSGFLKFLLSGVVLAVAFVLFAHETVILPASAFAVTEPIAPGVGVPAIARTTEETLKGP